jgi:hypothetical protein
MAKKQPLTSFYPVTTAGPNTASPTLSLHIPLILLGRKAINKDWDLGPARDINRLSIIRDALQEFCPEIHVRIWHSRSFEDIRGNGERRATWEQEEKTRLTAFEQTGGWALRLTDEEGETSSGSGGRRNEGEGLLTDAERKLVGGALWTCAFTLQRFGISVYRTEVLQQEVEKITRVLNKLTEFEYSNLGSLFKIVSTERCWPRLHIQPDLSTSSQVGTAWDEHTVKSILLLHTGFERELLTLATPTFLLQHWPLSHFLTHLKVRRMRREWMKKRRALGKGKGKEDVWERVVKVWLGEMEWEDEVEQERERVFGVGKECWEDGFGEVDEIIKEMGKLKEGLMVGLLLREDEGAEDESTLRQDAYAGLYASPTPTIPAHNSLSPSSPTEPFPQVSALIFSIPRLSTSFDPAPLLAYVELLTKLFLFAHQYTEDAVRVHIHGMRETSREEDERAVYTLRRVAREVGVDEGWVEELVVGVMGYWVDDGDGNGNGDKELLENTGSVGVDGKDGLFVPLLRHIRRFYGEEKAYMRSFLERYERAGGFLVPGNSKVFALEEKQRQDGGCARIW